MQSSQIFFAFVLSCTIISCHHEDDPPQFDNAYPQLNVVSAGYHPMLTVQGPDTVSLGIFPHGVPYTRDTIEFRAWDLDSGIKEIIIEISGNISVDVQNKNAAFTQQIFAALYQTKHILTQKPNGNPLAVEGQMDLDVKWNGLPKRGVERDWHWKGQVTIQVVDYGLPVGPEKTTLFHLSFDFRDGDIA